MTQTESLSTKRSVLIEKLRVAEKKENDMLARRGWGYAMRNVKIGFSTRVTDNLKERIKIIDNKIELLKNKTQ